jgi:cold shock CspA family protein
VTTTAPVQLTGLVTAWMPLKGFGFIEVDTSEGRQKFYAHAREFQADCACRQRHKCEIKPGMMVTFTVQFEAQRSGKLPAALQIREVKGASEK